MATLARRLGYDDDAKLVIISCDDLGSCHAANEGVYASLNERQRKILQGIRSRGVLSPRDLLTLFADGTTQRTLQRDLRELIAAELITADGKGRAVRYRLPEERDQ